VSKKTGVGRRRRRRSDADRNVAVILDTAVHVLNEQPGASIGEIAKAAGLTRQTVYAHFPSREYLIGAVVEQATRDAVADVDAADLDRGSATAAMRRYVAAGWRTLERYPLLLHVPTAFLGADVLAAHHRPLQDRLERLVQRGQETAEFDPGPSPAWLAAAILGLGHTAGEQLTAGTLDAPGARKALEHTVLRMLGTEPPPTTRRPS
jgi:AcrR family transcriptional regulator